MLSILVADDEPAIRTFLEFALEDQYRVYAVESEAEALAVLAQKEIDIVLLDLKLGSSDGIEVLRKIKGMNERIVVIIMTAYGSIKSSVEAMKAGAFYYIAKPIVVDDLHMLLVNAAEYVSLQSKVQYLNRKISEIYEVSGIIGRSEPMREIACRIEKLKDIETNVLITGESGTGKELVAKALHYSGVRRDEPFEVINCAAIPVDLLESELFGHEKGAFTGAAQRKKGIFELANKGTLFLDEIGEMDMRLQAKLLRVVQEREFTPLGASQRKKADVRIIAATNRNLPQLVQEGKFREDLFFRLNVVTVEMPPLRERVEDIPLLVEHFIAKYSRRMGKFIQGMEPEALNSLMQYRFRGNVRELENIIEKAIVFAEGDRIQLADLAGEISQGLKQEATPLEHPVIVLDMGEDLRAMERKVILETLAYFGGDKQKTAYTLKISDRKLWYKLKEYEQ